MKPQLLNEFEGNELRVFREFGRGGVWVQPKVDGVRCMAGPAAFWGRSGSLPLSFVAPHLVGPLAALVRALPDGMRGIDGELYSPEGASPSAIGRAILAGEPMSNLRFAAFDCVGEGLFIDRFNALKNAITDAHRGVDIVRTVKVNRKADIDALLEEARASGGEGLVVRLNAPYAEGQRQRHAFKLKTWQSGYGRIIGLREQSVQIQPEDAPPFWVKAAFEWIQGVKIGDRADFRFCGRAPETGTPLNVSVYW